MIVPFITRDICLALNEGLGITNTGGDAPIDEDCSWASANVFNGTYADAQSIGSAVGELEGKFQGCYRHNTSCSGHNGSYHFYQVLITR